MKDFTMGEGKKSASQRCQKNFFLLLPFLLFLFPLSFEAQTQSVKDYFKLPDAARCTSNDLDIISADLDLETCNCTDGTNVEAGLVLGVRNNTESLRTSFSFWAQLTLTDPMDPADPDDDLVTYYMIKGCEPEILPGSMYGPGTENPDNPPRTKLATFNDEFFEIYVWDEVEGYVRLKSGENPATTIPYRCGTSLEMTNIYQAWTDASKNDNRQCGQIDASKINPKCGIIPVLAVGVGLSATASTVDVSCNGESDGSITITFSGGKAPYYLDSGDGNGFSSTPINLKDESGEPLDPPYEITIPNLSGSTSGTEYTWKIKDSSEEPCIQDDTETIYEPDALSLTIEGTNSSCYNEDDGYVSLASDPTPANSSFDRYDLFKVIDTKDTDDQIISGEGGNDDLVGENITPDSEGVFDVALEPGDYYMLGTAGTLTTGQSGDCYAISEAIKIDEPDALSLSISPTDETCAGEDGVIKLSGSSNSSFDSYQLYKVLGEPDFDEDPNDSGTDSPIGPSLSDISSGISGLSAGDYYIIGTDDSGTQPGTSCTAISNVVTINGPTDCNQLFPTQTDCNAYLNCDTSKFVQEYLCVTIKNFKGQGGQITNVIPGAFFYYGDFWVEQPPLDENNEPLPFEEITIVLHQDVPEGLVAFNYFNDANVNIYNDNCGSITPTFIDAITDPANIVVKFTPEEEGTHVLGVKLDPKTLVGLSVAVGETFESYSIGMIIDGVKEGTSFGLLGIDTSNGCKDEAIPPANNCETSTSSIETLQSTQSFEVQSFTIEEPVVETDVAVYPNPFRDVINFGYEFDYSSDVTIQIFDFGGNLLRTVKDSNVSRGSTTTIGVDFSISANQMYLVRVTTDRETFVKQIVSSKK